MNKNIEKIIKKIKNNIIIIFSVIILFVMGIITLFNNQTIQKEIKTTKNNTLKALDQEGQSYRLVTSADNVQVPVPKGYVASNITGENYVTPQYQNTSITHKGNFTELTWSSPEGEQYPWTQDENGIWISGNQGIQSSTSTLESEEFDYIKGTTLTINYTYSCQSGDNLYIYLVDLTNHKTDCVVFNKNGNTDSSFDYITSNYTFTMNDWGTARYKIQAIYSKNASVDGGQDSAYIKVSTYYKEDENGTETIELDQKTRIRDGGFVIYQLTDEELEEDPNGTSVIINDTNKDTEQRTRNQYVWVPVSNIEDIVISKAINNGIMQFGQGYEFSYTSITKNIVSSKEPRLLEWYDKTKYYLQRYSNLDKRENYLNKMQEDYTRMIKSINKYKGFYFGRYETGDDISHSDSIRCLINPKIVRYNGNMNYVSWYDSYKDLERLSRKTEEYVETGILYDSLWDYTLKWLQETDTRSYEEIRSDSGTWGVYNNNITTSSMGNVLLKKTGATETLIYRGEKYSDSPTASNNIFDIAGNVYEWTMSRSFNNQRIYRGGYYGAGSTSSPAYYNQSEYPSNNGKYLGVRGMLLIR